MRNVYTITRRESIPCGDGHVLALTPMGQADTFTKAKAIATRKPRGNGIVIIRRNGRNVERNPPYWGIKI